MGKKKILLIIIPVIAVIILAAILIFVLHRKASYRLLKVYKVDGNAQVVREDVGEIEPYDNMVLESGDKVTLNTGTMVLMADEDKFITLEEGTELVLNAEGNSDNSKTSIDLTKGAITNDIRNKLSEESIYEVNTPNSTMSVRGTIYRVAVYEEDGVKYTRVSVFEGSVESVLIFKNGELSDEPVFINKGKEVLIYEDDKTTDYVSDPKDIDYSTLPDCVKKVIDDAKNAGRDVAKDNPGPFTVTFTYKGAEFGTQSVKKGDKVSKPTLKPAESGSWDYNFDKPVNSNIEIKWK